MGKVRAWWVCGVAAGWLPHPLCGQQPPAPDTAPRFTLPPITVSVTRAPLLLTKTPLAVEIVDRDRISRGRLTWGLDEALATVPGVYAANRYNFSLDQRLSIRGFGARAAFAVRGVKVLLDGIPQTLPDGQGQLTNLELGSVDRIEVLRGSSSALYGNAAGGVISIWTDPPPERAPREREDVRVLAGRSARDSRRAWSKWQSTTRVRLGDRGGSAQLTASRLGYDGERDHSGADFRNLNAHLQLPLGRWSLTALADIGDDPRADNPGALTLAELRANRDSAAAINLQRDAGKDVSQTQGGLTLRRAGANGAEITATLFGLTRSLTNPQTFAYIDLDRVAYGARITATQPLRSGPRPLRLTLGVDFQRQRDDRVNFNYVLPTGAQPDTSRQLDQLEHVTEIGPFVQSTVDLTPHAALTAGLRYDRVAFRVDDRLVTGTNPDDSGRRIMSALSGSVGLAVSPRDAVTVYGNVGSSFETPTTTELANRPDTAGGFNPTLNPQHAVNYEVGMRGRTGGGGGGVSWSVALFQADVRDELISYEVASSPQRRFFRNAGTARHRGVEVGADVAVLPGVTFNGTYTYADYRYMRYRFSPDTARTFVLDGRALPGVPPSAAHLALRIHPARALGGGAWVELETTYSAAYLVDDTLGTRTSPWWATNLRLGWEGAVAGGTRLGPFLGVNNLFNRLYVGSVTINAARGRYYEPAPGRSLYLGVTIGAAR